MKKIVTVLCGLMVAGSVFAGESYKTVTLINTSQDGYIKISYGFCGEKCSVQDIDVILYSKKHAGPNKPQSVTVTIPDKPYFKGVVVHKAVEEAIEEGELTEKVVAETLSSNNVCEGYAPPDSSLGPHTVLELHRLEGTELVVCGKEQS